MGDTSEVFEIFERKLAQMLVMVMASEKNATTTDRVKSIVDLLDYVSGVVARASKADERIMRCRRCGANESRIHGFCSVECEHYFDYEEEITELNARITELEEVNRILKLAYTLSVQKATL